MTEVDTYWGGQARSITLEDRSIVDIVICKPTRGSGTGLTFVLGAANIPLSKYTSIKDTLLEADNVVIGVYINVLSIRQGINHRKKAKSIREIFDQLKTEFQVSDYNIVGHSIGGKIGLLVAALHDSDKSLRTIIALDPVDQTPVEFTKAPPKGERKNSTNLTLLENVTDANIIMTCTDSGFFISKNHNARAIHKLNRINQKIKLVAHRNAGHMAYCDEKEGGYSWKAMMEVGTGSMAAQRNREIRTNALELIKEHIATKQSGNKVSGVTKKTGKVFKDLKNGLKSNLKDMTGEVKNVTSSGKNKLLLKTMMSGVK